MHNSVTNTWTCNMLLLFWKSSTSLSLKNISSVTVKIWNKSTRCQCQCSMASVYLQWKMKRGITSHDLPCPTHDLLVVSSIPSWGDFSFKRILASHLCRSMWEKKSVALERKVVLVLVWESQETHMRHRPPWYDLSC